MTQRKLSFSSALTALGWQDDVVITLDAAGVITHVETGPPQGLAFTGAAVPAMPNVHSHAHQRLMAGLAEKAGPGPDSFWTWREVMYGFALRLSPDDLQAVAAQAYVEMLKSGFSCVGEFHYLHHQPDGSAYDDPAEMAQRCLAAAAQAGIAMTLLPVLYSARDFGGAAALPHQRRFIHDTEKFLDLYWRLHSRIAEHDLWRLGVAPHSLRAVTLQGLQELVAGLDTHTLLHIHIAEQQAEVDACVAWSGQRPVEYLLSHLAVDQRWCAIHATHMTPDEVVALAQSGAVAGLCPITEANLGDGIFPARSYLQAGGRLSVGSDSLVRISLAEELRLLEYSQRLQLQQRNVLAQAAGASTGRSLYAAALAGGAQALGHPIGQLAPGYRCDVAVLDLSHPALIGRRGDDILDSWIFAGGNSVVSDMLVAGQHVVQAGRHIREQAIQHNFTQTIGRLT